MTKSKDVRCAWCGHDERDGFPFVPLGYGPHPKVWVHWHCVDDYRAGKRQQSSEENLVKSI